MSTAAQVGHAAGDAARETTQNRHFQLLGRIGLAAYGLVHFTIAYLAARVALGAGAGAGSSDKQEAVTARVLAQPFGQVLVQPSAWP